jgi:hypothetical protein
MLDEVYRAHRITGHLEARGYIIAITNPLGAMTAALYPRLRSDQEARALAQRSIDAIVRLDTLLCSDCGDIAGPAATRVDPMDPAHVRCPRCALAALLRTMAPLEEVSHG